uniref:cell division cycle-associated protein 2 isoform X2 n=1 Tax=Monopterus albus TaxID=43700 RepID=UPI0009B3F803|nr:cell division cycle-associated protein 2-like isoform X2 [Monopterus albus]
MEINTADIEDHQKEKMLSTSEEDAAPTYSDPSLPLNFSELTPCQFGISVQSFIPASSSKCKDKSRIAQIKARRRSSVGVRGSPETNSLIRFMAKQRMKTPPSHQTSEHVRGSPFLPRVASTLKQKIASFQRLIDEEEGEVCDPMPRQDSNGGGCIKTRDYLSDDTSLDRGKENHPLVTTPTPSKRRRLGPLEGCEEEEDQVTQALTEAPLPSSETMGKGQAVLISPPLCVDLALQTWTPKDTVFEPPSPGQPPPDNPSAASPARPASPLHISSLPSLLEVQPTGLDHSTQASSIKKKRVRFGGPLSPEFFDKNLPPSTPLQKGGTPARASTPGGNLKLRSVLKTPQAQPDLISPTVFGASPTLAVSRKHRIKSVGEDSEDKEGKVVFPSLEEIDSQVKSDTECTWDTVPLNLNTAFHEEFVSQTVTESEIKTSPPSQMDVLDEPAVLPETEQQPEAALVRPRSQRKKQPRPECVSASEAPARCCSRKRKPEESKPVKRSTRSAAKLASVKMKMTSAAKHQWNKDVDRSLYGSREYASKNPTLSPIRERLSFTSQSPAAQQTPSAGCAAQDQETHLNPEMANDIQAVGDFTVTNALEHPSKDLDTFPHSSKGRASRKGRRLSGPRGQDRGLKMRKVSVANSDQLSEQPLDHTRGKSEEHCEDQTTTNFEGSSKIPSTHSAPEQGGADIDLNAQTFAHTPSTDSDRKPEGDALPHACPPSDEELNTLNVPVGPEQSSHVEEGVNLLDLAPWQADFNFEDVFKPVVTRGQRSVRRSLRNQSRADYSSDNAGLAWLPQTSPDCSEKGRRRARGRRLSATLPVQPSLPEEARDNTS